MQRIAIDMDEVLADPIAKFIKLYERDYQITADISSLHGKELFEYYPADIAGKWFDYINEPGFFLDLDLIPGAIETVKKLNDVYEVYIVSAASEFRNSFTDKYDWLQQHFPFITWQQIMFCGKKIVDVDIMIDDRIRNFEGFKGRPLLFSSPHNLAINTYERVNNWDEVAMKLL